MEGDPRRGPAGLSQAAPALSEEGVMIDQGRAARFPKVWLCAPFNGSEAAYYLRCQDKGTTPAPLILGKTYGESEADI